MATKQIYTAEALIDMHSRTHQSVRKLLKHCEVLSEKELHRKIKGFGTPTVHKQLFHMIAAEHYWLSVVRGKMDVSMKPEDYPAVTDYQRYEKRVYRSTRAYLKSAGPKELNTARMMDTYHQKSNLIPAHVVVRTLTHAFQHQGQVLAMCRYMGHPADPGLDFPLKP